MTVSYASEVAQCTGFGCFPKLLLRWRASIYKLIWLDLVVYLSIYYAFNFTYRFYLSESQKQIFETLVKYCNSSTSLIPLMFVLGFYVSIVVKRWWEQYMTLPWPDSTAVYVSSLIRGQDENGRKMRRTIMRYVCLSLTMVLTRISPRVKKRFPTLDQLVDVGLLVENEKDILKSLNEKFAKHTKYWMPIVWGSAIVTRARKEGRIRDDSSLKTLIDSLNSFQAKCMVLTFYDTISIPLVYTQVVTIAVYTFFLASVFGRQWTGQTDTEGLMNIVDYFFPVFTVLEFMFFMGWLKVAESLISPFGEDDDDFELNWMIDRNLQVSYLIVDEMHNEHPELLKDQYWNELYSPYINDVTQSQAEYPSQPSADNMGGEPHAARKMLFNIPVMASKTRLFFKRANRCATQSPSVEENLNDINSALKRFFDPHDVRASQDPEDSPVCAEGHGEGLKQPKLVRTESETSFVKTKINENSDEFDQLKIQRAQERLQRQNFLLTIPAIVDSGSDIMSLSANQNSQEILTSKQSSEMQETKKDV